MKREAINHSKVYRLARYLDLPHYAAVGILECLWKLAEKEAPQGDIGKLCNEDIAIQIGWREDPERLVEVLIQCRLLDASDDHRIIVHDWSEHAEDGVHSRLARAGLLFANGKRPKLGKLDRDERAAAETRLAAAERSRRRTAGNGGAARRIPDSGGSNAVPNLTLPSQTLPSRTEPEKQPPPAPSRLDADSEAAVAYWIERSGTTVRSPAVRKAHHKRAGARLREKLTLDDLKACVDFAVSDDFYLSKGYNRDPGVFWKNAERVEKLAGLQRQSAGPSPGNPTGAEELPRQRAEREAREESAAGELFAKETA